MTIQFDVLQILTYMLIISFVVFVLAGLLFVIALHRYKSAVESQKDDLLCHFPDSYIFTPFFALAVTLTSFVFLLASSGAIVWLKLLATGSVW